MAFTYGFYNSLNGDRRYKAEDFGELVGSLITDGVFENIGSKLFVTAGTGMDINVGTGKAWFDNTWSVNDSVMVLTVPQSDITRPRIDTVVLEVNTNLSARENKIKIVSGEPAVTPVKPNLINNEKLHQHPLAHITVPAAATSIVAANIAIVVGQEDCPFCTGVLQKTDITDLYNQWEDDFTTWFNNLKTQLTDNVVANLQAQIDSISASVTSLETELGGVKGDVTNLKSAVNVNSLDTGSIFMLANGYNGTIKNALPCTGGSYSPSSYPTLFDRIGYSYGGEMNSVSDIAFQYPMTMYTIDAIYDRFTGNTYTLAANTNNTSGLLYLCKFDSNFTHITSNLLWEYSVTYSQFSLAEVSDGIVVIGQYANGSYGYSYTKDDGVTVDAVTNLVGSGWESIYITNIASANGFVVFAVGVYTRYYSANTTVGKIKLVAVTKQYTFSFDVCATGYTDRNRSILANRLIGTDDNKVLFYGVYPDAYVNSNFNYMYDSYILTKNGSNVTLSTNYKRVFPVANADIAQDMSESYYAIKNNSQYLIFRANTVYNINASNMDIQTSLLTKYSNITQSLSPGRIVTKIEDFVFCTPFPISLSFQAAPLWLISLRTNNCSVWTYTGSDPNWSMFWDNKRIKRMFYSHEKNSYFYIGKYRVAVNNVKYSILNIDDEQKNYYIKT